MRTVVAAAVIVVVVVAVACVRPTRLASEMGVPVRCLIDDDCAAGSKCVKRDDATRVCSRVGPPARAKTRRSNTSASAPSAFGDDGVATPSATTTRAAPAPRSSLRPGECRSDSDCGFPNRCVEVAGSFTGVCGQARGQETSVSPRVGTCHVDTDCPAFSRCEHLANGDYGCVR